MMRSCGGFRSRSRSANPSLEEFHLLFQVFAKKHKLECPPEMVDYLIQTHYHSCSRPLRRCQARDLMEQVVYYCNYNELPLEITGVSRPCGGDLLHGAQGRLSRDSSAVAHWLRG